MSLLSSSDLVVRAIVGGVATSLLEPALAYHQAPGRERPLLDPEVILRRATEGVELGHRALLRRSVNRRPWREAGAPADRGTRPVSPESIPIPVELLHVRVAAVRLQLPDPTDPVLAHDRLTLTIRLRVGRSWVATEVIEETVPSFERHGAVVDLHRVLYEGVVQSGEGSLLEVVAGAVGGETVCANASASAPVSAAIPPPGSASRTKPDAAVAALVRRQAERRRGRGRRRA